MPRHSDNPKTERLDVRFTPRELAAVQAAAKAEFLRSAQWARQVLLRTIAGGKDHTPAAGS